jgi:hypothetical protein
VSYEWKLVAAARVRGLGDVSLHILLDPWEVTPDFKLLCGKKELWGEGA